MSSVNIDFLCSSQASIPETISESTDKENTAPPFSSPQKSDCPNHKPRRPPTVTPKRFSRFFTPRASTRTKPERHAGRARRHLKDITHNGINSALNQAKSGIHLDRGLSDDRPLKKRRCIADQSSQIIQSSPIKHLTGSPVKVLHIYDEELDLASSTDEEKGYEEEEDDFDEQSRGPAIPPRIHRLAHRTDSQRLLLRSFGQHDSTSRGLHGCHPAGQPLTSIADYCSTPKDVYDFRSMTRSLPFCTAPCNTNSLIGFGDEDGSIYLHDTATDSKFTPHIGIRIHKNAVMDMTFSSCDTWVATAGGDQTVRVVDVQNRKVLSVLAGHRSSVKQVKFHPQNEKMLTTSARDGIINVWDLRCSGNAKQTLRVAHVLRPNPSARTTYPYNIMLAGPSHRASCAKEVIEKCRASTDAFNMPSGVSITAIQHLADSRSHLLLTASEQNSSLKLFDLRFAGRSTLGDKSGFEVPIACTPSLPSQKRQFGVSALVLSTNGSRAYSVCRDNTVWVYSTQHLMLGSAPEMIDSSKRARLNLSDKPQEGLGPLYGFRHPKLRVASFYVRAAIRKASGCQDELLAVGSQEACPVLFNPDEHDFRSRGSSVDVVNQYRKDSTSRTLFTQADGKSSTDGPPVYNVGVPLVQGHRKEVTALAFAHGGELVTASDDFTARCWREDAHLAHKLRHSSENKWKHGWADVPSKYDDIDDE